MQETIQEIAKNIGVGVSEIIPHYAKWYFTASIIWLLTGFGFIALGFFTFRKLWNWEDEKDRDIARAWAIGILLACFFIGVLFIGCNVADFFAPEGRAYHQLINDIRGN